jgi:RHS repeat-associated protein
LTDTARKTNKIITNGTQERTDHEATPEKSETYVDGDDSVTGLRSLIISADEPVEITLIKPLDVPATAPFGVSDGNFAIGEAPANANEKTLSRSRVLDRLRRDADKGRTRREDESALGNVARPPEEAAYSPRTVTSGAASGASGKSTKFMSAAPVGDYYIYSFDGKLLQVYDIYGTLLKDFVYMGNRLVAEYDHANARLLYYTPDQINSTRVLTDGVGNVVYTATYDPYGNARIETGSVDSLLKFSGKERDTESQLDYFGGRYYHRSQYRFISPDPTTTSVSRVYRPDIWNLYLFCDDSPINYFDPDGRDLVAATFQNVAFKTFFRAYLERALYEKYKEIQVWANSNDISLTVTDAFRTVADHKRLNLTNTTSAHEAGWAIDFGLLADMKGDWKKFKDFCDSIDIVAEEHGNHIHVYLKNKAVDASMIEAAQKEFQRLEDGELMLNLLLDAFSSFVRDSYLFFSNLLFSANDK